MSKQLALDLTIPAEQRAALEKERHELTQLTLLFAVYFPPDEYCRPGSKVKGKKQIPQAKWNEAWARAERVKEIDEYLKAL